MYWLLIGCKVRNMMRNLHAAEKLLSFLSIRTPPCLPDRRSRGWFPCFVRPPQTQACIAHSPHVLYTRTITATDPFTKGSPCRSFNVWHGKLTEVERPPRIAAYRSVRGWQEHGTWRKKSRERWHFTSGNVVLGDCCHATLPHPAACGGPVSWPDHHIEELA